tara:strand:+ start:127 stop:363 length:237 start_codon:yes stop_codon:yes gene_type:complete
MISHKIVKELGGTIKVNSIPAKGSVFTFTIPLQNENKTNNEETKTNENKDSIIECNSNQLVYQWVPDEIIEQREVNYF